MVEAKYDVVVVGGGIAGLTAANYLVSAGYKVLLLEHNHQVGGLTGGFERQGFYFDAGDQSFESGGVMLPLLKDLGIYRPEKWEHPEYALDLPGGNIVFRDEDQVVHEFADIFPQERNNIFRYFDEVSRLAKPLSLFSDEINPCFTQGALRWRNIYKNLELSWKYRQELKEGFSTTAARHVEGYFPGYNLGEKLAKIGYRNMPLGLGIAFWHTWFHDYWYPRDGLQSLMEDLLSRFRSLGGVVMFHQRVEEILAQKDRAVGVRTNNDDYFYGSWVVFAGSMKRLYTEYLPASYVNPEFKQKMQSGRVSEPLTALYLGVDIPNKELRKYLKAHHTFFIPEGFFKDYDNLEDPKLHSDGFLEITCPSFNNPALAPRGQSSLVLQAFSSYRWMDYWGTGGNDFQRTPRYRQLKQTVSAQMIATAARVIPKLKERVVYETLGTPLSTIHFTLNPEGASAGWTYDLSANVMKGRYYSLFTPLRNLLSIGHYSLILGGVPMAALTGWAAAQAVKHESLTKKAWNIWNIGQKIF